MEMYLQMHKHADNLKWVVVAHVTVSGSENGRQIVYTSKYFFFLCDVSIQYVGDYGVNNKVNNT